MVDSRAPYYSGLAAEGGGVPLLVATGISKSFGGVAALSNVGFDLRPGEIHALMGENGAGKSTLMKILSGVYSGYEGSIDVAGRTVSFGSVRQAEAEGIAIIHQELNLVPELTVSDNIFLGREPRIAGTCAQSQVDAVSRPAIAGAVGH